VALAGLVRVEQSRILRMAAVCWIDADPAGPADAVAVFGGGVERRPFAAADYYERRLVRKILVSDVHRGPAEELGVVIPDTEANKAVLLKLGVPESAIETFGKDLHNTHQEVMALLQWAEANKARSILVPTEIFSTRRVRWMLRRAFPEAIAVRVPALEPSDYHRDDWWHHEAGLIGFQNEVVKYVYYRLKY
jgi:uncharacterized SAM-binding protein YcdF (DUF218 family)